RPRSCHLLEKGFKRTLPAGAQSRDLQRPLNVSPGRPRKIEQRVDRRDGHALRAVGHSDDFVSGAYITLFEHAEIEPRALMRHQQGRHPGLSHAYADTIACHARRGHLKHPPADPKSVANTDLAVGQAFHCEVLSKLPEGEVTSLQLALPVGI